MSDVAEFIQCDARNYTTGRRGCGVSKIVVHYTSTDASAHDNLLYFSRSDAHASAHYFVDRDGTLRQSVAEADTAWHAGDWGVNLRSMGIEVVSAGEDFTEEQVATLTSLVADLRARYGIGIDDVIRHYDVTGKLCPAPYVNADKWATLHARICGGEVPATGGGSMAPSGDVADLARRTIAGEFGNGDARRAALGDRYQEVQAEVNRMLGAGASAPAPAPAVDVDELARRAIAGEFGNGDARRAALGADYAAVQARVNEMLGCVGGSGDAVDVEALAQAVIDGDYGNGEERKDRLGANYAAVQMRVNEILS